MDINYFKESEENCWRLLNDFNNATKVFNEIDRTAEKSCIDVTGTSINRLGEKRKYGIELKNRNLNLMDDGRISGCTDNGKIFHDDTLFIETHKVGSMLLNSIDGYEPLYINFLKDGHIIIFNLNKLSKRPKQSKNLNIKSRGYAKFEIAKREGLYLVDAAIYNKEYKLVKRVGEEWITKQ